MIELPDYQTIRKNFTEELFAAAQGKESSLPFIKNSLPKSSLIKPNLIFQVFVVGGTHGAMAVVRSGENKEFTILEQKIFTPLPIFTTKDAFLTFIDDNLHPETKAIGINFAYNLIPVVSSTGELDGFMNQGDTKGHAFEGLQQEQVGKAIKGHVKDVFGRDIIVSVANDAVCLIISGLQQDTDRLNLIAAIAGTGYNLALFSDYNTVVNLQATDFTGFKQTDSGKIVDAESKNIGEQLFNKEVAAGDLYKHFNALIPHFHLSTQALKSSEELSLLARSGDGQEAQLARELLKRSASLVASQLAGIYEFKGKPEKLVCIMQGSLFIKEPHYLSMIQEELEVLGIPKGGISFVKIANSDIVGAIKLITG